MGNEIVDSSENGPAIERFFSVTIYHNLERFYRVDRIRRVAGRVPICRVVKFGVAVILAGMRGIRRAMRGHRSHVYHRLPSITKDKGGSPLAGSDDKVEATSSGVAPHIQNSEVHRRQFRFNSADLLK